MDVSIRAAVAVEFAAMNLERIASNSTTKNRDFRAAMIQFVRDLQLRVSKDAWGNYNGKDSVSGACSAYNYELQQYRHSASADKRALVEGLGREEDKKGGRKKIVAEKAAESKTAASNSVFALQHIMRKMEEVQSVVSTQHVAQEQQEVQRIVLLQHKSDACGSVNYKQLETA